MDMKKFKIALLYMIYTGLLLAGCNDEERQTLPANEISDFKEQKKHKLVFDITDLDEENKAKLRGGICFFLVIKIIYK